MIGAVFDNVSPLDVVILELQGHRNVRPLSKQGYNR